MSKLSEMIARLCPNGVEYRPLWSVTFWDKKFNAVDRAKQPKVIKYNYFLANDLKPLIVKGGSVKLLTTNSSNIFTTEELAGDLMSEGEVVTIPWGGNPNVQYYKGKFLTADNRIATSRDISILDNKYLFYFMQSRREMIGSFYRGSGIKHPDMAKVLDLEIPLPPLPVQREIVQILDNFANLTAELTAELAKRKKQYEHYRDMLLNFTGGGGRYDKFGVEWKRLGEIGVFFGGLNGKSKTDFSNGNARYLTYMNVYSNIAAPVECNNFVKVATGEKQNMLHKGDVIFTGSSETPEECGMSSVIVSEPSTPLYLNSFCFGFRFEDSAIYLPEFAKFLFRSEALRKQIIKTASGVTRFNVSKRRMESVQVPIVPLAEQERIVAILDRFDSLCNSLTEGLPAEIALRKKQYEYYRDKLLSFKEAS